MNKVLFLPIRVQLFLMVLIMSLPAAASIVYSGLKSRQAAIEDAVTRCQKVGDAIAGEQQHMVASAEQLLSALAQLLDVRSGNAEAVSRIIRDVLALNPLYLNISLADRSGAVWASALPLGEQTMAERHSFRNALRTGRLCAEEYQLSLPSGKPALSFCYPYRDRSGAVAGAFRVSFRLDLLPRQIALSRPESYGYVILDRNGTVLAGSAYPQTLVGKPDHPDLARVMRSGADAGTVIAPGLDGKKRFITYRTLRLRGDPSPYLYVRSAIPVADVLVRANEILLRNLALFVASLACAGVLAWHIGKRSILDRLEALREASCRLAHGDLQVRVSALVKGAELGDLGRAFDDMAYHLALREKERAEAELALRQSESHYRSIFDNSLFGIAVCGGDGRFLEVNQAFCDLLGYAEQELVGAQGFHDLLHPTDQEENRKLTLKMVRRELDHYTLEARYLAKDGKVVRGVCFVDGVYDAQGGYIGQTGCILDITELKASEERMRLFFDRQLVGMAIVSLSKGWIQTNEKLHEMLGYSGAELAPVSWLDLTHPEDRERDLAHFRRLLSGDIEEYSIEKRMLRKDGGVICAEVSTGCVRDHEGKVECVLMLLDDITERKRAEEEINRLQSTLEQRVMERTAQLEAAIREQESFSYSVSHDLRSPLRHINSYLAIFTEEMGTALDAEKGLYLERARAASVKMGKLIDDLLELSRVSRSRLVKETVDLSHLAHGVITMLQETEPQRKVEVLVASGLEAKGDKVLISLVLENLIGNAWKYTSRTPTPRVELGAEMVSGERVFFVKDNGAGFDMTYKDKLFGAFQRLHGEEYEGTGIGLATVKRIVDRHGGAVWAASEPGAGATFYFYFP